MNFKTLNDIIDKYPIIFYNYELPYTEIILEMYNNPNIEPEKYDLDDHIILNLIGQYYHLIHINYDEMKKYYSLAIANSMHKLGLYFQLEEKNYELMKIYYLKAIDKGCIKSMYYLGLYYEFQEKNYNLMKKYYLMGIENGCLESMDNLRIYNEIKEK